MNWLRRRSLAGTVVAIGSRHAPRTDEKGAQVDAARRATPSGCGAPRGFCRPTERAHPEQTVPVRTWTNGCNGCHDSDAAAAYMNLETYLGVEACATCHGPGREFSVEVSHQVE